MSLDELRQEIDRMDKSLVKLLNERAKIALNILKEKQARDQQIYDQNREVQVLEKVVQENEGPLKPAHIKSIFNQIIESCRNLQQNQKGSEPW